MDSIAKEYAVDIIIKTKTLDEVPILYQSDVKLLINNSKEILNYVRNQQWEKIKAARDNAETSGLPFKNKVLDYDMKSAFKLDIAMETAKQVGESFTIDWTMQDNSVMTLTYEDLLSIPLIAANYSNELHKKARGYRDKIYNETNIEAIMKIVWE